MNSDNLETSASAEFDSCARDYAEQLNKGLALTGESKEWYAEARMVWLRRRLDDLGFSPATATAMDFGCGTGTATPFFFRHLGVARLIGVDPSSESLAVAREQWAEYPASFLLPEEAGAEAGAGSCRGQVDLAFCNGVFHHIPLADRAAAVELVWNSLRPGGLFAFWENNPWNPGTRFIMSRVPFDRDAILVWPRQARTLLRSAGFQILRTDFTSVFPKSLAALRPLEPGLCRLPLGGQYLVLCRK